VTISHDGRAFATVHPARLTYPLQRMTTTDVAIHTDGFSDRYVVLGDPQPDGGWIVRLYYNPLVPWVWFGAMIMVLGGVLSLSDRRLRIGAPVRKAKRAEAELAA
jgi:cytochrome c-type biogenesis protein CcmF